MTKRVLLAGLLILAGSPAMADESWIDMVLRGMVGGGPYTFTGWLACDGQHTCLTDGTYKAQKFGISEIECRALVNSAQAAGGNGGVCIPPLK